MRYLFTVLLAATAAFSHHTPVEPPLPPLSKLTGDAIGWYSPQPRDQSMYHALHPDSSYQYFRRDSVKVWYIGVIRHNGVIKAQRIKARYGFQRILADDPHFHRRIRSNTRYYETVSTNPTVRRVHWVWLFNTRHGARCYDQANYDRALRVHSHLETDGRPLAEGQIYLGVDYYPYYPDIGFVQESDLLGVITGHEERFPWYYAGHNTAEPYNHSPHGCGWPLPPWYRPDTEHLAPRPLDLPPQAPSGQSARVVVPDPRR